MTMFDKPLWMWLVFFAVVLVLIVFDLGVLQRKNTEALTVRQSIKFSIFYITMGLLFGVFVWTELGPQAGKDYLTGFVIEKSLSMDNLFVISLVFSYFAIPRSHQYRVLFWGVIGVIVLRGLLIGIGAELVEDFDWVLDVFAVFLIFTGIKMLRGGDEDHDIEQNTMLRFFKKHLRVTPELHGKKFFIRLRNTTTEKMQIWVTPLFISLLVVEFVDLIFAVDSVPAIFAITTDEYVVFTSNIFAILGLRALYFALSAMLHRFEYLNYSLAAVLIFIGGKVVVADFLGWEKFPSGLSLLVTLAILAAGVVYSLYKTKDNKELR